MEFRAVPFLKWAGGKAWLTRLYNQIAPVDFGNYHEPFLGGGAMFFHTRPKAKVFLSDANQELINTYQQVRDSVNEVIGVLETLQNTEEDYYCIRGTDFEESHKRAARVIYLNHTCFNGVYRVNRKGQFNVPYGHKLYKPELFNYDNLKLVSGLLEIAQIEARDFEDGKGEIKEGDFVFLDPPYVVSGNKNGFAQYNQTPFSWSDQGRLARYVSYIKSQGAYYILTNAKHPDVADLFRELDKPITVQRANKVGGKGSAGRKIQEYVFTNFNILGGTQMKLIRDCHLADSGGT